MKRIVLAPGIVLLTFLLGGWGTVGHRFINRNGAVHLPSGMQAFIDRAILFSDSAMVPDWRRSGSNSYSRDANEGPKHFMDIDDYPEFASRSVSKDLDSLIAKYGATRVYGNGINPWATVVGVESLTAQMRRRDWSKVWSTAADLGHYVGDAHQPLHNTFNYDGQFTGNNGIHARYESNMISTFQSELTVEARSVQRISSPIDYIFDYIYLTNSYVDSVLAADNYAKQVSGWSGTGSVPAAYYTALWQRTKRFTILQIQQATVAFANLLHTAWVNAGEPVLTSIVNVDQKASEFWLAQNYPNPFNPLTRIEFGVRSKGWAELSVYDLHGREIALLHSGEVSHGRHRVDFDSRVFNLSSGMYVYRLTFQGEDQLITILSRKLILLK